LWQAGLFAQVVKIHDLHRQFWISRLRCPPGDDRHLNDVVIRQQPRQTMSADQTGRAGQYHAESRR